jgi:hypothetical protein
VQRRHPLHPTHPRIEAVFAEKDAQDASPLTLFCVIHFRRIRKS